MEPKLDDNLKTDLFVTEKVPSPSYQLYLSYLIKPTAICTLEKGKHYTRHSTLNFKTGMSDYLMKMNDGISPAYRKLMMNR